MRKIMIAIYAIIMVLWLSIATIDHQLDLSTSHHTQHHCQLFSGLTHGSHAAILQFVAVKFSHITSPEPSYHYAPVAFVTPTARAPPTLN